MIADDGIGASTAKIAKAAGVAEGSLFRYFPDKDTLLNELYVAMKLDMRATTVTGFPETGSLRSRVQYIWNAYIDWGIQSPAKRKTMAQLGVSDKITEHSKLQGRAGMENAVKAMVQLTARGKLRGLSLTFAADLMVAMAETTIASMTVSPADAKRYRDIGFEAFWSAAAKK
jgi:AcrR family transcriptional regulator